VVCGVAQLQHTAVDVPHVFVLSFAETSAKQ